MSVARLRNSQPILPPPPVVRLLLDEQSVIRDSRQPSMVRADHNGVSHKLAGFRRISANRERCRAGWPAFP